MMVDVVDLGMGNVHSVANAVARLNVQANLVTEADKLKADTIIVPGVGAAGPYMDELRKRNFDAALLDAADQGKKIIGICLGFQILAQSSEENGGTETLGLLQASVEKLRDGNSHNGWETQQLDKESVDLHSSCQYGGLTRKRKLAGRVFYNHEYGFLCREPKALNVAIANPRWSTYSAMVIKDNIIGIQFHPEKSQSTGLELFRFIL